MANTASDQTSGNMNIRQNRETYDGFIRWTVRSCVIVAVVLALMAIFLL